MLYQTTSDIYAKRWNLEIDKSLHNTHTEKLDLPGDLALKYSILKGLEQLV